MNNTIKFIVFTILISLIPNLYAEEPCDPPSSGDLATTAKDIKITDVIVSSANPNFKKDWCETIFTDANITPKAEEAIKKASDTSVSTSCSNSCDTLPLAPFDTSKAYSGPTTVFVNINGDVVPQDQAICKISYNYAFSLGIKGSVNACLPKGG